MAVRDVNSTTTLISSYSFPLMERILHGETPPKSDIFLALLQIFSFIVPLNTALFRTDSLHSMAAAALMGTIKCTPCISGITLR